MVTSLSGVTDIPGMRPAYQTRSAANSIASRSTPQQTAVERGRAVDADNRSARPDRQDATDSVRKPTPASAGEPTQQLEQEQVQEVRRLAARDREVRTHERAHAAIGGQYAGSPVYSFQRGPDGVNYAVGGEVPIDTSKEASPEATLSKAQVIQRAALAPAEPSPQDRRVAAEAAQMAAEARMEIAHSRSDSSESADRGEVPSVADTENSADDSDSEEKSASAIAPPTEDSASPISSPSTNHISSRLDIYRAVDYIRSEETRPALHLLG